MFENLKIDSSATEEQLHIHLQWRWIYEDGKPLPSCSVFSCAIPEQMLLQEMIFRQDDILKWINREIVDISSPKSRIDNIEDFYRLSKERGMSCTLNQYSLMGNITRHVDMPFPLSDADKVFLVCVYGERSFEAKVISIPPLERNIRYSLTKSGGLLNKLLKKGAAEISFEDHSSRQRVVVTHFNGEPVYSVVPPREERYYLAKDIAEEDIKGVEYLSYQIGK